MKKVPIVIPKKIEKQIIQRMTVGTILKQGYKLDVMINDECDGCVKAIKRATDFAKQRNQKVYGSTDLKANKRIPQRIILTPDFNASGYITNWHVEFVDGNDK